MITRRNFLQSTAVAGAAVMSARNVFASSGRAETAAGTVMPTKGHQSGDSLPKNGWLNNVIGKHYKPKYRFGLGGVAIGNAFAASSDEETNSALEAAWNSGVRYFDTSPWYGLGLSERRFGHFLHKQPRGEFVLSTKVGRLFTAAKEPAETPLWKEADSFNYRYDYTADGVRRSIEDSLQRLGLSRIDVVFVHDLSPDNEDFKGKWLDFFEIARKGAFPALTKMREEGMIQAWGLGVNRPEPALKAAEVSDPDIFLLATQYSLLDHANALNKTFPTLEEKGVSVVVGSPLNAGYLAGRDRYNYDGKIPSGAADKRSRIEALASRHGIDLRTAALQFCGAHSIVSAVIPGARNAAQVKANVESMGIEIPAVFWEDLKNERLIETNAPVPKA